MEKENKRLKITIHGQVQGINFRSEATEMAQSLGLHGYAQNLEDGSVMVVAEGSEEHLDELERWCHKGPAGAVIESVESIHEPPSGTFSSFQIQ
jgi:acylphosphatase